MATKLEVSQSTVSRVWRAFGLQPHRVETFKLSTDPLFIDKVRDIVGLYLNPPTKAMVLCVDEKSQIQALDRTQPHAAAGARGRRAAHARLQAPRHHQLVCGLGRGHRSGHRRAASASSQPRSSWHSCARSKPTSRRRLDVHLILDNYGTHKTPSVQRLVRAPSALSRALHAHLGFLAQSGRALLRVAHRTPDQARHSSQHHGAGTGNSRISEHL